MIYARGTGDGIAWNGGERGTGGRPEGELKGDRRETGGELEGELKVNWRDKKKGGKPQSLRLTSLHL